MSILQEIYGEVYEQYAYWCLCVMSWQFSTIPFTDVRGLNTSNIESGVVSVW